MKFYWELLSEEAAHSYELQTNRAKIVGGWLLKESCIKYGGEAEINILFIEDKNHDWKIEE